MREKFEFPVVAEGRQQLRFANFIPMLLLL